MAKSIAVQDMDLAALEARSDQLKGTRSELVVRIRELQAQVSNPQLDPDADLAAALAALGEVSQELAMARAMEGSIRTQIEAVGAEIARRKQEEREQRAAAMQPEIDAAKATVCEAHQAYVAALERAREVDRRYTGVALSRSPLTELFSDDLRKALRQQAHRFLIHAPAEAEAAGVSENVLR